MIRVIRCLIGKRCCSSNPLPTQTITEISLQNNLTDEENNSEIMKKFSEETPSSSTDLKIFEEPLTSAKIAEAHRKKLETGVATFRKIVYSNGELDNSNLNEPPSPENPHPFNGNDLPPVYSHSLVPFVNHSPVLRFLIDIGTNLADIENSNPAIGKYLMRLRIEDIKSKIELMQEVGFQDSEIGEYLTRNPFFLLQDVNDMRARLNYLELKKFQPKEILKIVKEYRYWLNCGVKLIDSRLGWIQQQFKLTAKATREIIVKEPRIIMFGTGPIERIIKMILKEFNFSQNQLKELIIDDPRLFMMDAKLISRNYRFIRDVMRINNETIMENPFILRCSISSLKTRHDFLKKMGRSNYRLAEKKESKNDRTPLEEAETSKENVELVDLNDFLRPSDADFAKFAAKTYPVVYEKFLRNS